MIEQVLEFVTNDSGDVSVVSDIFQKCHWMQVECHVGSHRTIVNAYMYANTITTESEGNRFLTKYLFTEIAHLLHDTSETDVCEWYDRYIDVGPEAVETIMDQIHDDIDSNAFTTLNELKTSLEHACHLDVHSHKDKIFELAKFSTVNKIAENLCIPTLANTILHQIADNYLNLACVFIPNYEEF